ncbi:MAG TPA: lipid II flippase MurJ, partial [Acidimicrobiales bacterium]|nr:lipid II flippase MurJ [Acidimicrobiales bacterium]
MPTGPIGPLDAMSGESGIEIDPALPVNRSGPGGHDADTDVAAPDDDRAELRGVSQLVRSSSIVGAGTLLSRVSGLVRTVAIAAVLGAHTLADGYNLANTTPNMIYDLLLGGVFTATLVPVFVDHHVRRDDEGDSAVLTVLVAGLIVLTGVAMLLAPWIFRLYTWNIDSATDRADIIAIGVPLLRWFLPQILFYGLTALASAVLNARRSYLAPAFVPALNNLVVLC